MVPQPAVCRFLLQQAAVEKWFSKQPSVVSFDDRLQFYNKTIDELATNVQLSKVRLISVTLSKLR